jgi:ornithine carbamoyltransferase
MGSVQAPQGLAKDFLQLIDLGVDGFAETIDLAGRLKANRALFANAFAGQSMICLFEKPSTRTRLSLAIAARRMGLDVDVVSIAESQVSRGESLPDTGRVVGRYAHIAALRTYGHDRLVEFARSCEAPVINALSDDHHPCQALADALTMREHFGELAALTLAFIGDAGGNIAHSLIELSALSGLSLNIAAPIEFPPNPKVLDTARRLAVATGATIRMVEDPNEAVSSADVVYPDVWVPMGKETERERRTNLLAKYRVDGPLMMLAKPNAIFMHCLPAYRGWEVTDEVMDGHQSAVWRQAENRIHTSAAVIHGLLTANRQL